MPGDRLVREGRLPESALLARTRDTQSIRDPAAGVDDAATAARRATEG